MRATYKVIQSNPNSKGGFVTKLQSEIVVSDPIFGDKTKKETFYISGTNQVPVDTEIQHDHLFPKYKVVEHEMINPQSGETFMGKWLHLA
jgi:hypothetical protein